LIFKKNTLLEIFTQWISQTTSQADLQILVTPNLQEAHSAVSARTLAVDLPPHLPKVKISREI